MFDNEKKAGGDKSKTGWTDKERLVYLIGLLESTGTKLDFKNAPRPIGRSEIACERMFGRLKTAYKAEIEALKAGQAFDGEATPKATPKKKGAKAEGTPKRKGNGDEDADGSPTKRGKKVGVGAIKTEIKDEPENEI